MFNRRPHLCLLAFCFLPVSLVAQSAPDQPGSEPAADDSLPAASVSVELSFSSNYVFRGYDFFTLYAQQQKSQYGSSSGAWVFTPSITISPPVEGLWINLFGAFAMYGRDDVDIDHVIQNGPGGSDLLAGRNGPSEQIQALVDSVGAPASAGEALAEALRGASGTGRAVYPDCEAECLPGYYKEAVGLRRLDEFDLGLGYERETQLGIFALQYYVFNGGNPVGSKGDDYYAYSEIGFGYAPPFLTQLRLNIFMNASTRDEARSAGYAPAEQNYHYYQLAFKDSAALSDDLEFGYGLSAGYGMANRLQGWQDITANLSLSFGGFKFALNGSYRPDLRWYDTDSLGKGSDNLPVWLVGGSSRADGLVEDPSRVNDPLQRAVNRYLTQVINEGSGYPADTYVFTQRQRLPRFLYWITLGYTISI